MSEQEYYRNVIISETMNPPPLPPPASTTVTKLRLMCSYGGHIVPRANGKSLFYAGGETRIVSVDRSSTASSLSALTSHLSIILFNNRPLRLKYQLPDVDLDSLVSVATDEDLLIMLEEHAYVVSTAPSRIRLFLFPSKPEPIGSGLLDTTASESWFCDALESSGIVERVQPAESGLVNGLMGLDITGGPESAVFETSSSFGSTGSLVSMANSPPIGVQSEEPENKVRMPSSASVESDTSIGSSGVLPNSPVFQESHGQVALGASTFTVESESAVSDPLSLIQMQNVVQVPEYQLPKQSDAKQYQHGVQYVHGSTKYLPQYSAGPLPQASYYPIYQIPIHQQQHSPYSVNQPYPLYLVPVRPVQSYNMSVHSNANNNPSMASSWRPFHPQTTTVIPPMVYKETVIAQPTMESAAKVHGSAQAVTPRLNAPSCQGQQQFMVPPEPIHPSQPAPVEAADYSFELDDNLAYTQIYKTQPPAPALSSQFQLKTKGTTVLFSDLSMPHLVNVKHQVS